MAGLRDRLWIPSENCAILPQFEAIFQGAGSVVRRGLFPESRLVLRLLLQLCGWQRAIRERHHCNHITTRPLPRSRRPTEGSNNMQIRHRKKSGFTLVELMIVVAIIGLLAAIAIPNFVRARTSSQTNACINNLRQIDGAKQQWALENHQLSTASPGSGALLVYLG